jgi:hypothetical protein
MKFVFSVLLASFFLRLPMSARAEHATAIACAEAYVRGQILRRDHKLIQARDVFRACAQTTCKDFIVRDCSAWLDMVQASLPAVIPLAVDDDGNALSQATVSMDGMALLSPLDGRSIEVDPGPHTFTFEVPDGRKADKMVIVPESDKWVRVTVTLARPPVLPSPDPEVRPPIRSMEGGAVRSGEGHERYAHAALPWRGIGLAVTGVGVLGLGSGAFFGFDALSKRNAAGCNSEDVCSTASRATELSDARRSGAYSTVFLAVGGGLAVAGATLWAIAPSYSVRAVATFAAGGPGFVVNGTW